MHNRIAFAGLLGVLLTTAASVVRKLPSSLFSGSFIFTVLGVGALCILAASIGEWRKIVRTKRSVSGLTETAAWNVGPYEKTFTGILTLALTLFFFQFVRTVYAMGFPVYSSSAEANPTFDLVMADFNNDGYLDYVAGNSDMGTPSYDHDLYRNNGTGTFTRIGVLPESTQFKAMKAGDINGDGNVDIVQGLGLLCTSCIIISKNDGNFSFTNTSINTGMFTAINDLELADVDNDGDLDIVVVGGSRNDGVYLNDGKGNFTAAPSRLPAASHVIAADFNNDGVIDIALSNSSSPQLLTYKNSGTGAFTPLGSLTLASNISAIAAGDLDGDGDIDILATDSFSPGYANAIINDGTGVNFSLVQSGLYDYGITDVILGDVDNDGDLDMLDGGLENVQFNGNELRLNNGSAAFTFNWQSAVSDFTHALVFGDIDRDGDLDFIAGNTNSTNNGDVNRIYKSDQAATSPNTAPTTPGSFSASVVRASSASAMFASSAGDDSGTGSNTWNNVNNALTSNDQYAVTSSMLAPDQTHYLKLTGYGFSVPANATIVGIEAEIDGYRNISINIFDAAVRLVKNGVIQSGDRSSGTLWTSVPNQLRTFGSGSDLWGTTWTPADVNAVTFGFAISVKGTTGSAAPAAYVDSVKLIVHYTTPETHLSWGSGSDTQTATRMLQYQVRVGTGSTGNNIVSGRTASPNYVTRLMPNGQSRTMVLKNLLCNRTYYWSVATVDTGFMQSPWATEQSFTLDSGCSVGGSPPPSPPPAGGGGTTFVRPVTPPEPEPETVADGTINITAFRDSDGNASRSPAEPVGFEGLVVTVSGKDRDDKEVTHTGTIGADGTVTISVPPSNIDGYTVTVDTGSTVVKGFRPTSGGISELVIRSNAEERVWFGFQPVKVLRQAAHPCLAIGQGTDVGNGDDAMTLLLRLEDSFGRKAADGVTLDGMLFSRRTFFTLLQKTQCLELYGNEETMAQALRKQGQEGTVLKDLPRSPLTQDALLVYSLLADGLPVERQTTIGPVGDLGSPISRKEVIEIMGALLKVKEDGNEAVTLPKDFPEGEEIAETYRALLALGLLPKSFTQYAGLSAGIGSNEAVQLLIRAALSNGKIGLVEATYDHDETAAIVPTFLRVLPTMPETCMEKQSDRAGTVRFNDLPPGSPLFADARLLAQYGTKNSDSKMLWLMTGTEKPTETGVERGQSALKPNEAVSVLELLRALEILSCKPPETATAVTTMLLTGIAQEDAGTGIRRSTRDRISGLPRSPSFEARVLYAGQDEERTFSLSLLKFAQGFLEKPTRSPDAGMTVQEASEVLASAVLGMATRAQVITPVEADGKAAELAQAIRAQLLKKETLSWQEDGREGAVPFTRGMLIDFLATVASGKKDRNVQTTVDLPIGELWWERVR